jgi:hypothetical protein
VDDASYIGRRKGEADRPGNEEAGNFGPDILAPLGFPLGFHPGLSSLPCEWIATRRTEDQRKLSSFIPSPESRNLTVPTEARSATRYNMSGGRRILPGTCA